MRIPGERSGLGHTVEDDGTERYIAGGCARVFSASGANDAFRARGHRRGALGGRGRSAACCPPAAPSGRFRGGNHLPSCDRQVRRSVGAESIPEIMKFAAEAFEPLRAALEAAGVRYAVGGSWASTAFGEPR